jgi:DNA (cytosine-5)-methyltransferase 1
MIGIDLFAGAGGLTLGAKLAGIKIAMAIEQDAFAAATYRYNHPEVLLLETDIKEVKEIQIDSKGEETILFGGPPCQGFSTSNQRTRNAANSNNWMFQEFFRLAKLWRPDWIVLENVRGIVETENGMFLKKIIDTLRRIGYSVTFKVLDSADFGVPQHRNRVFIVGSKKRVKFGFPAPSSTLVPLVDALDDLPELENGNTIDTMPYRSRANSTYADYLRNDLSTCGNHLVSLNSQMVVERYRHVPQGGNWEHIPASLMSNYQDRSRCHTGIYRRLDAYKPSVVIGNFRKNMLIHPTQDRGLSVREAARIQSFPDSFRFLGSIGFQQQQVGNAVPPLLSKAVFNRILELN